jgi:hypothetical protein
MLIEFGGGYFESNLCSREVERHWMYLLLRAIP